jgi:hypothetical protein
MNYRVKQAIEENMANITDIYAKYCVEKLLEEVVAMGDAINYHGDKLEELIRTHPHD